MKKYNKYEFACNIRNHYVGDKYLQVMLPYKRAINVVDEQGVLFHRKKGTHLTINKYLNDERKKNFPYSNIPEHKMITPCGIIRYTNQLLEFNRPYIIITNGVVLEEYAVKNNDNAILITKAIAPQKEEKILTLNELRELVYSDDSIEKKFSPEGGIYDGIPLVPEEEKIIKKVRDYFFKNFTDINHIRLLSEWGQCSIKRSANLNDSLRDFLMDNYPLENILNVYLPIILNDCIVVYKDDNGINNVKAIAAAMKDIGKYQTNIYNFPITHYTLDEAKSILQADKNKTAKEPRISRLVNKGIDKELIKQEKARVKKLTKK